MTDIDTPPPPAMSVADAIAQVTEVLAALRAAEAPSPLAATDADGFPGAVAAGELIESAWGNAVRSKLFALAGGVGAASSIRIATLNVATNGNGDAIVAFNPPFPNALLAVAVADASQSVDVGLIPKVMWTSSSRTTLQVRVFLHDGSKVTGNGAIWLTYIAYGR